MVEIIVPNLGQVVVHLGVDDELIVASLDDGGLQGSSDDGVDGHELGVDVLTLGVL